MSTRTPPGDAGRRVELNAVKKLNGRKARSVISEVDVIEAGRMLQHVH